MNSETHAISRNPATGEIIASYPYINQQQIDDAICRSFAGAQKWGKLSLIQRIDKIRQLGQKIRDNAEDMATLISNEMGKPILQARGEVNKSANLCDWYAEQAPSMLAPQSTLVENDQAHIEFHPLGLVLAVMPWNFPLWQVLRGAIPIMIAGNGFLLKHAPNVMGCAFLLQKIFHEAGFNNDEFNVINATPEGVSQAINDPRIVAVTFTGSVRAGMAIGSQAGAALKKSVLELGGSDPFIVLNDAPLEEAVKAAVAGRYQNTGQVCAAAKRFIVEAGIADEFTKKFVEAVKALPLGEPLNSDNYIGPMARFDLRDELHGQVTATLAEGATLLTGGHKLAGEGNYYAPTVLANVTPEMTAFRQELFGPVAAISIARDVEHAIELANASEFGLTATVYSVNEARALKVGEALVTGGVFINGYSASDPRVAFGGVKKSGYGRELSHFGLLEFCNIKTVWKNRKG